MFENNHSDTEVIRKPAYAKATTDSVEPSRIKSNSFLMGMRQIERFLEATSNTK